MALEKQIENQRGEIKMAKNWKVGEAVLAIKSGSTGDKLDIGRRFPLFAILAGQTNEAGYELLNCVPDHVTARKIESVLKGDVQPTSDDDSEEVEEVQEAAPVEVKKAKTKAKPVENEEEDEDEDEEVDEYAGKTAKQLYDLCKERGLKVEPKQKAEAYAKVLTKADAAKAKAKPVAKAKAAVEEEPWDDEDEAPKTKAKPAAKAKAKDEDEWDI